MLQGINSNNNRNYFLFQKNKVLTNILFWTNIGHIDISEVTQKTHKQA